MKIVIDVSVIGLAQLFETARTGIFRVISHLSEQLLGRDDLEINYGSLSSLQVNQLTDDYFRKRQFEKKSFPKNSIERFIISLAGYKNDAVQKRKFVKILSRLYRMSQTRRIGKNADIFHSMYSALPRFHSVDKPVRMMTIYDIIPLIHPEYFADGFVDEFRPIVESLSPHRDYVFTISECTKLDICEYFGIEPNRVFVAPPAASTELYHPVTDLALINKVRKKYNIPDGRYFLTLATVEKRKNLETSIKSFRQVLRQPGCEDLFFVLVGTRGWKVNEIIDSISKDTVLRSKVIFTGFIPDKYLSAIYSGAEGFIYPSLYEGFGLPPLEAMQCGVPVITSNTSSLPEVVGDSGILVDPKDTEQISQAMLLLLTNSELRESYIRKGKEKATHFSWESCANKTIAGYQTAWDGR